MTNSDRTLVPAHENGELFCLPEINTALTPTPEITLQSFLNEENKPFLMVCVGLGRDSLAVLIMLNKMGIRPELLIFADTGNEKPSTYNYIPILRNWLAENSFPDLTIVKAPRTRDQTLESMCLRLGVFPSISYRSSHRCSVQWKIEAINHFLDSYEPVISAKQEKRSIVRAIGFEAGEEYRARRADKNAVKVTKDAAGCKKTTAFALSPDEGYISFFPLIEEGIDFDGVLDLIIEAKLPIPPKSACFMCAASKPDEIEQLAAAEPHLFFRSLVLERVAQRNKVNVHTSIQGLNFGKPWAEMECAAPYLDRLDEVIELFDLDRTIADGIPSSKNQTWRPKAYRVELFRQAFATKEQLTAFMQNGSITPEVDPSINVFQFDKSGDQIELFTGLVTDDLLKPENLIPMVWSNAITAKVQER